MKSPRGPLNPYVSVNSGVHYYHLEPEIYRFNVLLHKPLTNYNDAQKDFYRFVLAYFANAEK